MNPSSPTTPNATHESAAAAARSPWPHRMAMLLALVTFPLIWVGGLVTSQDAGMAVPDWPGTYGYNLFLYPIEEWWLGPWDLFIEHGHRLLGSLAGLVAIALVFVTYRSEPRRWVFGLSVVALLLVIAQGALGGVRVLAADRAVALVHGCVGPAFFGLSLALLAVTSRRWTQVTADETSLLRPTDWAWTLGLAVLAYLQLVIGANMRHISVEADPIVYRTLVTAHVTGALLVVFHALRIGQLSLVGHLGRCRRAAMFVTLLVLAQFLLGAGTWMLKFGIPSPYGEWNWFATYVVPAKSMLQANIVTAHVAIGSLVLGSSIWLMLIVGRHTAFVGTAALEHHMESRKDRLMGHGHAEPRANTVVTAADHGAELNSGMDGVLA